MEVIVHRCDLCGEIADCLSKRIDDREYDLCPRCWRELAEKLRGKGRPASDRELVLLPPRTIETEDEPEKPLPGGPPTIKAKRPS
ncbi:MAG TPA: hypothetical protein VGS20_08985 [Candidatus Acidoferrales bacterium]|nr:hypothetical protein [Candidatus Acidoferrales bacterium]